MGNNPVYFLKNIVPQNAKKITIKQLRSPDGQNDII